MSNITDALTKLKSSTFYRVPCLPAVEQYLHSGDQALLAQIRPMGQYMDYWVEDLVRALRAIPQWEGEDRRVVHIACAVGQAGRVLRWLDERLPAERPEQDFHAVLRPELKVAGDKDDQIARATVAGMGRFVNQGAPASAGRYVLSLDDKTLEAAMRATLKEHGLAALADLLVQCAPQRIPSLLKTLLTPAKYDGEGVFGAMIKLGHTYEPALVETLGDLKDAFEKFHKMQVLYGFDPRKYHDLALEISAQALQASPIPPITDL